MGKSKGKIYLMVCGHFPEVKKKDWLNTVPELSIIADVEVVEVFDDHSVNVDIGTWLKLSKAISSRLTGTAGFVVLHNIDNILYTANALNFLLQNITVPIVFTGGQAASNKVDFKANIINAVQTASNQFSEICLMFGNRLIRASHASQGLSESLNLFHSPDNSILGRIDFSIRIFDKIVTKNKGVIKEFNNLNNNVAIIDLFPSLDIAELTKNLPAKDGVIIRAQNYEELPQDLLFILQKVVSDIPVIVWTNKIEDSSLAPKNIIIINNMTWEATVTKFLWALAQEKDYHKIKELMIKDISGEVIH